MKLKYITIALVALLFTSCNDFLDIRPTGMIIARTGDDYRALLIDQYHAIPSDRFWSDLRTDDVVVNFSKSGTQDNIEYDKKNWFEMWNWTDYNRLSNFYFKWQAYYKIIYIANYVIEHKNEIEEASQLEINQLVGESYMLRAYMHFLLVNIYAPAYTKCEPSSTRGVPLQLKADVRDVLKCSSVQQVYNQVLSDIDMAEDYMNVEKWDKGYTYRFSKITANALRARVALYMGNWQLAYKEALRVIDEYPQLQDLNSESISPSNYESVESILALEKEENDFIINNAFEGFMWASDELMETYGYDPQAPLSGSGIRAYIPYEYEDRRIKDSERGNNGIYFGTEDKNKDLTKGPRYYYYKPLGKDLNAHRCTFRSAEFYLIASEAANELNNTVDAKKYLKDLMVKRFTANSYNKKVALIDAMNQDELREEIYNERRREFAFQGHRWFDLRRTTQPEIVREYIEDGVSSTYTLIQSDERYTLRFPIEAVDANPGLELWPY